MKNLSLAQKILFSMLICFVGWLAGYVIYLHLQTERMKDKVNKMVSGSNCIMGVCVIEMWTKYEVIGPNRDLHVFTHCVRGVDHVMCRDEEKNLAFFGHDSKGRFNLDDLHLRLYKL